MDAVVGGSVLTLVSFLINKFVKVLDKDCSCFLCRSPLIFQHFSRQIWFSSTFQDSPSFSSTFQACANPGFIIRVNNFSVMLGCSHQSQHFLVYLLVNISIPCYSFSLVHCNLSFSKLPSKPLEFFFQISTNYA